MNSIEKLVNEHVLKMTPYSSARDDFKGQADIYLDANESYDDYLKTNRYPDPESRKVRKELEKVLSLPYEKTALGNGSDEVIDLLLRIFCKPGSDKILIMRPTYGAYKVFAAFSNIEVLDAPLKNDFSVDMKMCRKMLDEYKPKLTFICSPNNPAGTVVPLETIKEIASYNKGITVVDEAYGEFASNFKSAVSLIDENERIVVMKTLSKAWALAGARIGILIANPYIISLFVKVKPPYNVSLANQKLALETLKNEKRIKEDIASVVAMRSDLEDFCSSLPYTKEVIRTQANFILLRVEDADSLYRYLMEKSIIVRNRDKEPLLKGVLRITVGNKEENEALKEALLAYK